MYLGYPNLFLVSLAHVVLNLAAVMYCFVGFVNTCG